MNLISRHGLFVSVFIVASFFPQAQAGELTLALANSTCDAMNKVEALYRASHPVRFTHICKSSGLLAKGLSGGALKADVFISADRDWMDFALGNGLVASDRVASPWGNALVVASAKSSPLQRLDWQELASDKVAVILIGDPSTAPFGRHAKEALEATGLWEQVRHKIQTRKHVQLVAAALATSSSGTVGILFKSNLTDQLRPVHAVDPALHKPIRYYMAPLKASADKAVVTDFLEFLRSEAARDIFRAEGFDVGAP